MSATITPTSHIYSKFRGVDFSSRQDEVSFYRSPDALNMWKNYKNNSGKCVETRPDLELIKEYDDAIYGIYFYEINKILHKIVHSGTKLYDDDKVIYNNMANNKTNFFVFNDKLYIKDSVSYLVYDGTEVKEVDGYIPTTTISKSPSGGGQIFQDINLLTDLRKNSFVGDGKATEYILDAMQLDSSYTPKVWVNDNEVTAFTIDYETGKVTFTTAPSEPLTVGQDNVIIQFKKTTNNRSKIEKCTLSAVFDTRIFFSGNPDYPNMLWHCSLNDPSYCSDYDYYTEGVDDAKIKSIVAGNNALWVMKEPNNNDTTIFYHNPVNDENYGKIYSQTHSSISTGCVGAGINFNDDICFFSDRGMEAISGDVTTEQVIVHRSSLVDSKLLTSDGYENMLLEEWDGYLLVIIKNKVFLADSKNMSAINNNPEYEWFYWEFDKEITSTRVKNGVLYLCSDKKVYSLTKTDTNITSYWCTLSDEFEAPQYQKTTNKRGCVVDMNGEEIDVYVRTDNKEYEKINTYQNVKGYVVPRIKKKKWKALQIKFVSNKPFNLYSCTLESYVGSYVKR